VGSKVIKIEWDYSKGERERERRGRNERVNIIKVHSMHVWKCHNKTSSIYN
jgi:hypothetical protein